MPQHLGPTRRTSRRRCAGLTLVEMMLAMAITALIVAAISAMLMAVAYGTSSRGDMRGLVMKQKLLAVRLDAAIRGSKQVLSLVDGEVIVLWLDDADGDENPSLGEVRRIEFDAATGNIKSYKMVYPDGWTTEQKAAVDWHFFLDENANLITAAQRDTTYFQGEIWATSVTGLSLNCDPTNASEARMIAYRVALNAGDMTDTLIGAAAMRR